MIRLFRYALLGLPLLRLVWRLFRDRRVPIATKALPLLALAYVISPLDFVPDILPLVGWLDDLLVAAALLLAFVILSPWKVVAEHALSRPARERGSKTHDGVTIDSQLHYEDGDGRR